jgi:hypothetical protein
MSVKEKDNNRSKTTEVMILSVAIIASLLVGAFVNQSITQNRQVEEKVLIKIKSPNTVEMIKLADSLNRNDLEMKSIYDSHKSAGQVSQEETEFVMEKMSENNVIKRDVYQMVLDSLNR